MLRGFQPEDIFTAQALRTAYPQISCVCAQCAGRAAAQVTPDSGICIVIDIVAKPGSALVRSGICMIGAARSNCQTLMLSLGALSSAPTASMPAAARPHCVLHARDFGMRSAGHVTSSDFFGKKIKRVQISGQNRAARDSWPRCPLELTSSATSFAAVATAGIHIWIHKFKFTCVNLLCTCVSMHSDYDMFLHTYTYIRASRRQGLQLQCHCQRRGGSRASRQGRHRPQRLLRQGATDFQKSVPQHSTMRSHYLLKKIPRQGVLALGPRWLRAEPQARENVDALFWIRRKTDLRGAAARLF